MKWIAPIVVVFVVFVALAAAAVWFHLWEPFHKVNVIGLAATLIGGYPIFKEALENIVERRMTMELSMTIALVAASVIREFFTALLITVFVTAGLWSLRGGIPDLIAEVSEILGSDGVPWTTRP